MSGASDKARFYLEQQVPELQAYERKQIFTKKEIASIAKKRSDFEHKLNARGATSSDFVRYVEYEINLDALRQKRVIRLGIKNGHGNQKRIFFLLDRATRKFQGDVGLWMQYIEYARHEKAYKKLTTILTNVLRFHPADPALWIYAARFVLDEQADMTQARSYMQRGLRFCQSSRKLWLEYAKLEMIYIAKIAARRQILGVDREKSPDAHVSSNDDDNVDADVVLLPKLTAEDINPSLAKNDDVDVAALQNLDASPVLSGAVPIVIFDTAMKQFQNDDALGKEFFDLFAEFENVPCLEKIIKHVVDALVTLGPKRPCVQYCHVRQPNVGVRTDSPEFAVTLGLCLSRLKEHRQDSERLWKLSKYIMEWLCRHLHNNELDPALRTVIIATVRRAGRELVQDIEKDLTSTRIDYVAAADEARKANLQAIANQINELCTRRFNQSIAL